MVPAQATAPPAAPAPVTTARDTRLTAELTAARDELLAAGCDGDAWLDKWRQPIGNIDLRRYGTRMRGNTASNNIVRLAGEMSRAADEAERDEIRSEIAATVDAAIGALRGE